MSGLGDRIRGMLFTTRLAAASQRVVLFTWKDDPAEPQAFLAPAALDWTLQGTGYSGSAAAAASTPVTDAVASSNSDIPANSRRKLRGAVASPASSHGVSTSSSSSSLVLDAYSWKPEQQETLRQLKNGFLQQEPAVSVKFVTIHTNERAEAECAGCPPLEPPLQVATLSGSSPRTNAAACLFRMLFKPR